MKYLIEEQERQRYYNHLSYIQRIILFLKTKKRRFAYILLFILTFNYTGNVFGFVTAKAERVFKKYKKRWILKYNPYIFTYQSALDTQYTPSKLSQPSVDRLSEAFLKYDRQFKNGFSRQLIVNILMKMGKMDEKQSTKFMADSGYMTMRKRMLCSMYMKDFFQLIEQYISDEGQSNELQFVNEFLRILDEEAVDFEIRVRKQIEEFEKGNLGPHGKEAEKVEEGKDKQSEQQQKVATN